MSLSVQCICVGYHFIFKLYPIPYTLPYLIHMYIHFTCCCCVVPWSQTWLKYAAGVGAVNPKVCFSCKNAKKSFSNSPLSKPTSASVSGALPVPLVKVNKTFSKNV